jgi:hypothetical protein
MKRLIVLVLFLALLFPVLVSSSPSAVTLTWDPVIHPDLSGYRLYTSYISGAYTPTMMVDVGNVTQFTWQGLDGTRRNYFVATAYSIHGEESDYSNEVFTLWGFKNPRSLRH